MKLGFTGSQSGPRSRQQELAVAQLLLENFEPGSEFHDGCCIGWDETASVLARIIGYQLIGHPPTDKRRMNRVEHDRLFPEEAFLKRDHRIVDVTEKLVAAPGQAAEVLRSGTWATIRYAVKVGRPGLTVYPGGLVKPLDCTVNLGRRWR